MNKLRLEKLNVNGKTFFERAKPDGTKKKLLDISLALSYGWKPKISFSEGFDLTYKSFLKKIK